MLDKITGGLFVSAVLAALAVAVIVYAMVTGNIGIPF
jgi:hypothetical protein